jgi:Zn-dependent protease
MDEIQAAPPAAPPELPGASSQDAEVQERLRAIRAVRPSSTNKIVLLVVTLLIFGALASWQPLELGMIVGVLLLHEAGHALAMKAFGYRDVSVFFIPFLGAAASGKKECVPVWQAAVVSLSGPLPGAFLGLGVLWANAVIWNVALLDRVGLFLVLINLFNLVPFVPFDGGRFFNELLFGRHRALEAIFGSLSGLAVLAFGIWAQDWVLGVVGGLALMSVISSFKIRSAAEDANRAGLRLEGELTDEELLRVDGLVATRFPDKTGSERVPLVQRVLAIRPGARAGAGATLGLVLLYFAPLAASAGLFVTMAGSGALQSLAAHTSVGTAPIPWLELAPPGLGMSVTMPGEVKELPAPAGQEAAGPLRERNFLAQLPDPRSAAMLKVLEGTSPADLGPFTLAMLRGEFAGRFGAQDAVHTEMQFAGLPAWRTTFTFHPQDAPALTLACEAVWLFAQGRIYGLALFQPAAEQDPELARRLFGSFRLLSAPPGPTPAPGP